MLSVLSMLEGLREMVMNTEPHSVDPGPNGLHYTNTVHTVRLVDDVVPLETLLLFGGGFTKSVPHKFPALVIRMRDTIGSTTHMLFRSGKMNTVGAVGFEHARYTAQCVRLWIETFKSPFKVDGKIQLCTLEDRTRFIRFSTRNIVATAHLDKRPNLAKMRRVMPDVAKWLPEAFPGLRLLVWVRPKQDCHCVMKKNKRNCSCNVVVVLFANGKFNVTGGRSSRDINTAIHRLKLLFEDETFCDNTYFEFMGFKESEKRRVK